MAERSGWIGWTSLAMGPLLLGTAAGCGARTGLAEEDAPKEADAAPPAMQRGDASARPDSRADGLPPCSSYTTPESCARGGCAACLVGLNNGTITLFCIEPGGVATRGGGTCGSP
jgi:hypothetical protein